MLVCTLSIASEMLLDIDVVELIVFDMIAVLDFGIDVSAFVVKEVELSPPFVVLLPSNEMSDDVRKVLVFVSGVVIGLESGLSVDVVDKDITVED